MSHVYIISLVKTSRTGIYLFCINSFECYTVNYYIYMGIIATYDIQLSTHGKFKESEFWNEFLNTSSQ